ncbi:MULTISPECIES: 3-hydroxyacyl-CoA dehydrogenase NAD-binding domain-containing protein [unclassified Modestobacter]|uniref:3-hydroxyacyl-CoA dehydrogenase NAD-binding domain-containing protein n=1 Tax=unclassified Modestobacter TaxID=2643866 RepID=UPI0022AA8328|nr:MULTISPECIES: 3-hydroxyacyl-CoA dehydrogenase NAD-binding domain-containing protein [unclassified Modestobacter]MCZ2827051.1 3-hydroxyacyl-CoA dehydrogenase NAD-binding domain-containing protein [Modestobacter sp. VKM Ac-2981]MCZ2855254.1 3-hydroxyacyl-CoA dehydrogenase NAD-binding domain-containing protein [Modestobacter sp. VKM Ac-2982]
MSAVFADEVVTVAKVRYLRVPGLAGELALITLDNGHDHTRPSTFGPGGLASLDTALDEIEAHSPAPAAVAVTGKPFIFAVGADLSGVPSITSAADAREIAETGHRVFRRLKDSAVPTFAFVNGAAMGGGLELALHCHHRTIASTAVVAFPEVFLGLVPGWGGTQLLPELVGIDAAVTVIVENALAQNKVTPGPKAAELGIADAVFEPADFLERSLEWAAGVLAGDVTVRRPEVDRSAWDDAIGRARQLVAARTRNASPGALRAVELLDLARAGDAGFTAGTAAEDDALTALLMSDELRAGLYAFDLVNKRAKRPAGAPDRKLARKVTKVGVVGAGLMASQLALLFVRRLEVPVVLTDVDQARVDKGVGYVHAELEKLAGRGRLSPDALNRLRGLVTGSLDKAAFADADLVIEAVFEELSVKQQVFAEVEAVVRPECVLATNTSALSVTEMAAGLQHPERVVGLHFFNPVVVLPLLEVVRAERTDDATLATAFAVGKQLGKSCVLVADAPAFVVNRLLTRFLGEVTAAVDAGTPVAVAETALEPLGLPMTPFELLTLVGPPVALHVAERMHEAFPDRFGVGAGLRRMVELGKTSVFVEPGVIDPELAGIDAGDSPLTAEELRSRAERALAEEIGLMLQEGVVQAVQDIDLAMLLGAGWPFWLGGISAYLDRAGVSEAVTGKRFLPRSVASLPA